MDIVWRLKVVILALCIPFLLASQQINRKGVATKIGMLPTQASDTVFTLAFDSPSSLLSGAKIGILGSSTMAGYGLTSTTKFETQFKRELDALGFTGYTVYNNSVSGYTSTNILPTSLGGTVSHNVDDIISASPDIVLVGLTTNDFASVSNTTDQNSTLATTYTNYDSVVNYLYRNGVKCVIVGSSLPRTSFTSIRQQTCDSFTRRNAIYYTKDFYANVYNSVLQPGTIGSILTGHDQGDGIHLDSFATAIIAKVWAATVKEAINKKTQIKKYYIQRSNDGSTWTTIDSTTSFTKTLNRPDTNYHYYRVQYKTLSDQIFTSTNNVGVKQNFNSTPVLTYAQFNLSKTAAVVTGWTNVAGDPATSTPSAVDAASGIGFRSRGFSNWNSTFGSSNAQNGNGQTVDDGGGFAFPAGVVLNYWYNYLNGFSTGVYQTEFFNLNPSYTYKITILPSRSSTGGATSPRTGTYHVYGAAGDSGGQQLEAFQNTSHTLIFDNIAPNADGTIYLSVGKFGTSGFGYLNGIKIEKK